MMKIPIFKIMHGKFNVVKICVTITFGNGSLNWIC
jgi:hypothetical protein